MSEHSLESQTGRVTRSFLSWVKDAVDVGVPVFVKRNDKEELSKPLKAIASAFKVAGLSDEDIMALAKSGESAALLDKAMRDRVSQDRLTTLRRDYQTNLEHFTEKREELSQKYGLNEKEMFSIFKELTKLE